MKHTDRIATPADHFIAFAAGTIMCTVLTGAIVLKFLYEFSKKGRKL